VAVTGVSGSGKSTLVFRVIEQALRDRLAGLPIQGCSLEGAEAVDKLIRISQRPIGRTPRSNPATYTGVFDTIRELFAATHEARVRGYAKGRFSFNVAGGRCEACQGAGVQVVEMQFLPSVAVTCDVCLGRRFNAETLEITWGGRTIHDVLDLTAAEAADVFSAIPRVSRILRTMVEVGLGYVPLGQPSTTLSGGEAQRVKLATELHRPATGDTLYLLDEPTTGLHFDDVAKLVAALQRLVDAGNTVVVVEHHTDVIKCADHVIDLGPEGGDGGGRVVGEGTPEAIARLDTPTGQVLAALPDLVKVVAAPLAADAEVEGYSRRRSRQRRTAGELVVRGARLHNLHDVDVDIQHGQLTVITGPSGSGKTSLAFDTVFAEGQRQYVESLSTYARRFLGRVERPPVDRLEGLQPAIAIDQRATAHNPRSTVATVTEVHDVLRLLYARVGQPHCPACGRQVRPWSPSAAAGALKDAGLGAGWLVAPLRPTPNTAADARCAGLIHDGWLRLLERPGNRQLELSTPGAIPALVEGAWLVVDRLAPGRASRSRMAEAIESAYALGDGRCVFIPRGDADGEPRVFTVRAHCPEHGAVLEAELTPRHFSFNSQLGACRGCDGLGVRRQVVLERLFPCPELRFWDALDGRVAGVLQRSARSRALIEGVYARAGVAVDTPWADVGDPLVQAILHGVAEPVSIRWSQRWGSSMRRVEEERPWLGLLATLDGWSSPLDWLVAEGICGVCEGGRLRPELLAVTIGGLGVHELTRLPVESARAQVDSWELNPRRAAIAERPLLELRRRLRFLQDVGLGYLGLDRSARTLSGGEAQRIRLASQLGSMLTGVAYVLDEPTIGLHARDTDRLLGTLEGLRDLGNTVLVVEHDLDTIRRADRVIDLGPGAGVHGGRVLAVGTPDELAVDPLSVTGRWLGGSASIPVPATRRRPTGSVTLVRPRVHNVDAEEVRIPLGVWVAVTGVSGSGKSSVVMDALVPAIKERLGQDAPPPPCAEVVFDGPIDRLVVVDQSPLGRTPRSTPATYTKIMDALRELFATTSYAAARGWKRGRFSYNSTTGGRCGTCEGRGAILVEMHFLPDVWVGCDACGGARYDRETLGATWRGRSIADVLGMRCDEALELFANHRKMRAKLASLVDVGLGYLQLGQPANTLSGGEAQRVKLAAELTSRRGHCVYVLDEPTTGLHLEDVSKLVGVLHRLVDAGHTVITIEHHLDVVRQSDHVVELGPEGGAAGGRVVAIGTPEVIRGTETATGAALRREAARTPA
ncbi:MAG: excinuclease ABC subunit A, partial [Myxococcota bacterium]